MEKNFLSFIFCKQKEAFPIVCALKRFGEYHIYFNAKSILIREILNFIENTMFLFLGRWNFFAHIWEMCVKQQTLKLD